MDTMTADTRVRDVRAAHVLARHIDAGRVVLDCGHLAAPDYVLVPDWEHYAGTPGEGVTGWVGYARDSETGRTMCRECADAAELESMRTADRVFCYLSSDRRTVTTWTGGVLGRVTSCHVAGARWSSDGIVSRVYVHVTDAHGATWHGQGPNESGSYVRLRRSSVRS